MLRILIADDHPMLRSAIATLLERNGHKVVGEVQKSREILPQVRALSPDVLLLDVSMPEYSGLDVLKDLRGSGSELPVVLVTAMLDVQPHRQALAAGVNGVFLKSSDPALLLVCLDAVAAGGRWFDPSLDCETNHSGLGARAASLSPRELEIVELIPQGLRNREIAERLGVTEGTVKVYLHAIFEKLQVRSRTELAMIASDALLTRGRKAH
jgi:two-component system nitrate/nitrite response regulator NarP